MDCVHCLIAFANNKSCPRISLKAVALLRICEDRLAEVLVHSFLFVVILVCRDISCNLLSKFNAIHDFINFLCL